MSAEFEGEYEDYLWSLELSHKPVRPPRAGFIGECVYAEEWELHMQKPFRYGPHVPNQRLADILRHLRVWINQRHATIAASVICWCGTNCGRGMTETGKRLDKAGPLHGEEAYRIAWASANSRLLFVNHGVRTLEHLMAPEDHYGRCIFTGAIELRKFPDLTAEDYECAENVATWLGSDDGQSFIANCERRIKELEDFHYKQERLRMKQRFAVSAGESHGA